MYVKHSKWTHEINMKSNVDPKPRQILVRELI